MNIRDRIKELRRVPANELRPNPKNWRTHPEKQLNAIRGVLAEVGFAGAELARELEDGTLELIDGHARAEVAGTAEVPVLVLDVNEAEANKILATFDPIGAMADSDAAKLDAVLRDVETANEDLSQMIADLANEAGLYLDDVASEIEEDEIPEPPAEPITKPGDLWVLGRHRLLCGDSTREDDVRKLMNGEKADMVFTDPPYGVNIKGGNKGNKTIAGDLTQTAIPFSFDIAVSVATKDDARLYFCGSEGNICLYQKLFEKFCRQLPRHLIWVKNGFSMKPNGYHNQYEIIFHGYKEGGGSLKKWFGERTEDAASDVWKISRDSSSTYLHPTQKPIALPTRAITNSCPKDGLIFEPFGGSGSTLMAAHETGRKCFALEFLPEFCDVIVERWQNLTGEKAKRENGTA